MNISQLDLTVLYIIFFDLTPRASGESPTVRSLEIAELDQSHRGIWITPKMPGLRYQIDHQLFIPGARLRGGNRLGNRDWLLCAADQRTPVISAEQTNDQHDNAHQWRYPGLYVYRDRG